MSSRVVLIIQARMGSTRLPGKSMMDLAGAPVVGRILERVKRCQMLDEIVLAVPDTVADKPLMQLGRDYNVTVFAGAEHDLVERYYQAACLSQADIICRLPADNVAPEPEEIDRMIKYHCALAQRGFSSNLDEIRNSRYPNGIGVEVFDFSLLVEARDRHTDPRQREHVHLNFFDYATQTAVDENWCPIRTISCPEAFRRPDIALDVNTMDEYRYLRQMYEDLYSSNPMFHITDIIRWHDEVWSKNLEVSI